MKNKCLALLLALLCGLSLTAHATSASTVIGYTLEEKLMLQWPTSGSEFTLSLSADGEPLAGMDSALWTSLKALLPQLTLTGSSTVGGKDRESVIALKQNENVLGQVRILNDGTLSAVNSNLISADAWYSFDQNYDLSQMLSASGDWPSIYRIFYAISSAPEEWHTRADAVLTPYTTKLAVWVQGYSTFETTGTNENTVTKMDCEIPASDMIVEIKQLLVDLYADEDALSLLREVFNARENAAYLQPAMRDTFFTMLDQMQMSESVKIHREFDSTGKALMDTVTLPFGASSALSYVTLTLTPDGDTGMLYSAEGVLRAAQDGTPERAFKVTLLSAGDSTYTGSVSYQLPAPQDESFTVDAANEARLITRAFTYDITVDPGEETYDLSTDMCEHVYLCSVKLMPADEDETKLHPLSLEGNVTFSSKSSRRSATTVTCEAKLTDEETKGSLSLAFTGKTTIPTTPATLAELTQQPMRIDTLESAVQSALLDTWQKNLTTWLAGALAGIAGSAQ